MSRDPAVRLERVGKRFGARRVLREVHGEIRSGSIVSLVGASGSGKTTLLRCLNGLEVIDEGRIGIAGHVIAPEPRDAALTALRADVGMVFQDYQLFPHLTVLENLCLGPKVVRGLSRHDCEKRARSLLERVGLEDRHAALPSELSGGQKQRVALARALAQDVKVLLLDEPTSALDARTRNEMMELLRQVAKGASEPLTLVVVTHDLHLAESLSDEVWTLVEGQLTSPGK